VTRTGILAVLIFPVAFLSFSVHGADKAGDRALPEDGKGIASRYPGDVGIAKEPSVIYATGFENGIEGGLKKQRAGVVILNDSNIARTGKSCAQITAIRGKDTGGDLKYMWKKGVDRCFVRFYCRFGKDTVTPHHFVNMGGHMPTYRYRWGGGAGLRPPGGANGAFSTTIEPPNLDRAKGKRTGWAFYTYWHEMHSWQTPHGASAGKPNAYYGNNFRPDRQRPFVGREKWICVEFMVKLNAIDRHDGEQAFWVDGKLVGHWKPGSPVGTWIRDKFATSGPYNTKPRPFEGFSWRTDKRLKINKAMLQWYVSARAARDGKSDRNIVYFDNFVIATKYIGPIASPGPFTLRTGGRGLLHRSQSEVPDGQSLDRFAAREAKGIAAFDQRDCDRLGLVPHADRER